MFERQIVQVNVQPLGVFHGVGLDVKTVRHWVKLFGVCQGSVGTTQELESLIKKATKVIARLDLGRVVTLHSVGLRIVLVAGVKEFTLSLGRRGALLLS